MENIMDFKKTILHLDNFVANLIDAGKANSSINTYTENILSFSKWFKNTSGVYFEPSSVTESDIENLCYYLQHIRLLKETTINLRLTSLKRYFLFLQSNGYVENYPLKNIKRLKSRSPNKEKSLDDHLYDTLNKEVYRSDNLSHICMFNILSHGLRVSELISIRLDDIDINDINCTLRVSGYGGKIRYVSLNSDCMISILKWLELRKKTKTNYDTIFISERKAPYTRSAIWRIFSNISKKAGTEYITIHSFSQHFPHTILQD